MSKCPHSTNTQSSAVGSSLSDQHSKMKEPVILLQQKEETHRDKNKPLCSELYILTILIYVAIDQKQQSHLGFC